MYGPPLDHKNHKLTGRTRHRFARVPRRLGWLGNEVLEYVVLQVEVEFDVFTYGSGTFGKGSFVSHEKTWRDAGPNDFLSDAASLTNLKPLKRKAAA